MWQKNFGFIMNNPIVIIFIITIFNSNPYFTMGDSTSISPLITTLICEYPENHKNADFTYNSLGSDATIIPVEKISLVLGGYQKSIVLII